MRELVLRLEPGADLRRSVEERCRAGLPAGGFVVCGIGSLANPVLRLAGERIETRYDGPFELLSLAGTVTPAGAHLHASIASREGRVFGGHVAYGNEVRTTAELLLVELEAWSLSREHDARTGFAELVARLRQRVGDGTASRMRALTRRRRFVAPRLLAGLLAAVGMSAQAATPVPLAPGEYELTAQTVLPHLEEALRYATVRTRECLRAPDATSLFPLLRHPAFAGCELVPDAQAADGLRFVLRCTNPQAASGVALFEADAGRVSAVLELKMGGKNMTVSQRLHGPRVGPCAQAEAN